MRGLSILIIGLLGLSACSSTPDTSPSLSLPDTIAYSQKDPKWADHKMGGSGQSMAAEGCLVTSAAMALGNLGISIDPGKLNRELKKNDGYTSSGLLVWSGIERVTDHEAKARFHTNVSSEIIDQCMRDDFYPLVRFILPNGRTHWAMIVSRGDQGYYMRDPLHPSRTPLLFPRSADAFKAVRCIGLSPYHDKSS